VLAARQNEGLVAREALTDLCQTYWLPLYAFIRRQGYKPPEAEDLTQEFFYQFLERDSLAYVRPTAGKFRSFLLACLKNFLSNERQRTQTQRRGGGVAFLAINSVDAETHYSCDPADDRTPEADFERQWAFAVLARTMKELKHEHDAAGKPETFEDLQGFLPGSTETISRAELAARRHVSLGAIDVAIHRLRQRFGALLRQQVAQTVSSESEVDAEIRHLITVLGR
jgi:RNA polymerase sigma-70 factor (ECF subfamily)